jgi:hypothetical protein
VWFTFLFFNIKIFCMIYVTLNHGKWSHFLSNVRDSLPFCTMSHLSCHPITSICKLLNSLPLKVIKSTDFRLGDLQFIAFEGKVGNLHQLLLPYQVKHSVGVSFIKSSGFD